MSDVATQPEFDADESEQASSGRYREIRWEVVTETFGITPARIIAGRLESEGIPARAWQEGAGEALGLYIGKLGTGYVGVPVEYAERARAILAEVDEMDVDEEE